MTPTKSTIEAAAEEFKDHSRQRLREAVYAGAIQKPDVCSKCGQTFNRKFIQGECWARITRRR